MTAIAGSVSAPGVDEIGFGVPGPANSPVDVLGTTGAGSDDRPPMTLADPADPGAFGESAVSGWRSLALWRRGAFPDPALPLPSLSPTPASETRPGLEPPDGAGAALLIPDCPVPREPLPADAPVEPLEPVVSAYAVDMDTIAAPTPSATANAPTRPT